MAILKKACVCGHDHLTHRGEEVHRCLDCRCSEYVPRCQNCGEAAAYPSRYGPSRFTACSRRCSLQLDYATERAAA